MKLLSDKKHPALLLPGIPELVYCPKVPVEVDGVVLVPDVLLRIQTGRREDWVVVEIDEGGVVTEESRARELALCLPTVRLTEEDILRSDFVDHLVRCVQRELGLPVSGYLAPPKEG